jgi:hypothetical protein
LGFIRQQLKLKSAILPSQESASGGFQGPLNVYLGTHRQQKL